MARTLNLTRSASVTLDGSGAGTASLGPSSPGEVWQPQSVNVKVSTNTSEATCRIYAGDSVRDGTFVDGTTWGSTGDSTDSSIPALYPGQLVFAVWSGGDAGATGTVIVRGQRQVP